MSSSTRRHESGLDHNLVQEITQDFRAYRRHLVNPSLAGLTEYVHDNIRPWHLRKDELHDVDNFVAHLWNTRDRNFKEPKVGAFSALAA